MKKKEDASLLFSGKIYSPEALKIAAAIFTDKVPVRLRKAAGGTGAVFPDGDSAGMFANEVLNQQCRIDLAGLNSRLSSIIVTKALLSAAGKTGKKVG